MAHDLVMDTASPIRDAHVARRRVDGTKAALVALEVLVAVAAFSGGIALAANAVDTSSYLAQLPFSSTSFAGVALAVLVAVPATVAALGAILGRESRAAHITAGSLLMGWIVAEVLYIGVISWLQPAMFIVGAAIVALAWLRPRRSVSN
jgi:hypothetical protein